MRLPRLALAGLLLLASCAGEIETPGEALRIFGDSLPRAYLGERYEAQIRAVGGLRPFTYLLQEGELPPGLELEAGVIEGVPTEAGNFDFTITVTDANLSRTFQDYSLEVVERPPPRLSVIAPQTEIRTPVVVRLQVENATRLRAFTGDFEWDGANFELLEESVAPVAAGAALVWQAEPGRLHIEMAALGDPWNDELTLVQFTLVPKGAAVLHPSVEALFFDDSGASHYQGGAEGQGDEMAEPVSADEQEQESADNAEGVPGESREGDR
ncbi:MAG TPA: Ig domain-containing protein [Trueperaceae bacterium]